MKKVPVSTVLFLCLTLCAGLAKAQEDEEEIEYVPSAYEFGIVVGTFLPNQINNVTEILPAWGGRYAWGAKRGAREATLILMRGKGTVYYMGSFTFRQDWVMDNSLQIYMGVGGDIHYYSPADINKNRFYGGGHVAGGFLTRLQQDMWFRAGMKFNVVPGTSLLIEFGFQWRFPEDEGGGE